MHDIATGLDVLLDFSKAFDKVHMNDYPENASFKGNTGRLLNWIRSFLANRTQQVLVEGWSLDKAQIYHFRSSIVLPPSLSALHKLPPINDLSAN